MSDDNNTINGGKDNSISGGSGNTIGGGQGNSIGGKSIQPNRPEVYNADVTMENGIGIHDKTGTGKIVNSKVKMNGPVGVGISMGEVPDDIQKEIDAQKTNKKEKPWLVQHFLLPLVVGIIVVVVAVFWLQPLQQKIQSDTKENTQPKQ